MEEDNCVFGATVSGAAGRPLTDFEQVLLAVIASEPRSGYGLKKMFTSSPASAYQPSPGALYPALRRLEERGLLRAEQQVSSGRRALRLYQVTDAGLAVYLEWLRRPVVPETVAAELGQHLMRFSLMENYLERAEVIAFLTDLGDALDGFVTGGGTVRRLAAGDTGPARAAGTGARDRYPSGQPGVGPFGDGSAWRGPSSVA